MSMINRLPYLTPSDGNVAVAGWIVELDKNPILNPEFLPNWDPAASINANIDFECDVEGITKECELDQNSLFRAAVFWHSSGTGLRGRGDFWDFQSTDQRICKNLRISVDGFKLAQNLTLAASLTLIRSETAKSVLAPKNPGSILWQYEHTTQLEGSQPRFPVELRNFRDDPALADRAVWYLSWDEDDLDQLVLGGMRLYINSSSQRIRESVLVHPNSEPAVREAIYFDVARSMITSALRNNQFTDHDYIYSEGTIGASLRLLVSAYFPGESFNSVRSLSEERPEDFLCELQNKLGLFGDQS